MPGMSLGWVFAYSTKPPRSRPHRAVSFAQSLLSPRPGPAPGWRVLTATFPSRDTGDLALSPLRVTPRVVSARDCNGLGVITGLYITTWGRGAGIWALPLHKSRSPQGKGWEDWGDTVTAVGVTELGAEGTQGTGHPPPAHPPCIPKYPKLTTVPPAPPKK